MKAQIFALLASIWIAPDLFGAEGYAVRLLFQPEGGAGMKQEPRVLQEWSWGGRIPKVRTASSRERESLASTERKLFSGVLLADLMERALEKLSPDERAKLDLLILVDAKGGRGYLPRAFLKKYRFLLAQDRGESVSVVPWDSEPAILREGVYLEPFFRRGLREIVLTSYQTQFPTLLLRTRSDPGAIRGEKFFVKNCASCHSQTPPAQGAIEEGFQHPVLKKLDGQFEKREVKALGLYLSGYRGERAGDKK
jgi:hypothetical protein